MCPPLVISTISPGTADLLLVWLFAIEAAWGDIGSAIAVEELGADLRRSRFSIGPGLFRPANSDELLRRIERAVLSRRGQESSGEPTSYSELAAHVVGERPELAPAFQKSAGSGGLVRALRDAAVGAAGRGHSGQSLALWRQASALAPGNRAVLRGLVGMALRMDEEVLSPSELAALEEHSPLLWDDAVMLGRVNLKASAEQAAKWADRAIGLAPERREVWSLSARAGQALGDRTRLENALVELSALGERGALQGLAAMSTSSEAFRRALEHYSGEVDRSVWQWRLARLLVEERFGRALQMAASRHEWLMELPRELLSDLLRAARNHAPAGQGSLAALARLLDTAQRSEPQNRRLSGALAEALFHLGANGRLLELWQRHPGSYRRSWWLSALQSERRWRELLEATEPGVADGHPPDRFRLRALVQLALASEGAISEPGALAGHVGRLAIDSEGREWLEDLVGRLRRVAPNAAVTVQLVTLMEGAPGRSR